MPEEGIQIDRPIALVGMMGAGKSSLGRRLARRLDLTFVDSDDEIEQGAGMPISEIFRQFGEPWFRERERQLISRLAGQSPLVIATGGGAFTAEVTRIALIDRCLTVWLDSPIARLVERVGEDGHRPLLGHADRAEALDRLTTSRRPFYEMAHLRVENDNGPPDQIVDQIVRALARWRP